MAVIALASVVAASRAAHAQTDGGVGTSFEETYRGRHITGVKVPALGHSDGPGEWHVAIDGHPLHLMRRADGTWLTMIDMFHSYRTPLTAARGAVDTLGPNEEPHDLAPGPMPG